MILALGLCLPATTWAQNPDAEREQRTESARAFDEVADSLVAMMARRWVGPRVPHPEERARPDLPVAARSWLYPLAVHAGEDVAAERVDATLAALEFAYALTTEAGFGLPALDGGRGGTGGFDLYLAPEPDRVTAYPDASTAVEFLDGVMTYAVVDPNLSENELVPCVARALAEASFLSQDPAEPATWRHAYGAWLAVAEMGDACGEPVAAQQEEPWRSYVVEGAEGGAGGALLLEALALPRDGGTGRFVRDAVQLARQRTWEGDELRGSPDLWEALSAITDHGSESQKLGRSVLRLAADRYFMGHEERRQGATNRGLLAFDEGGAVPMAFSTSWQQLPKYSPAVAPAIRPYGAAYARVDVRDAPANAILRVWLRGEFGVEWTMATMRLDAHGHELGRMRAPPRGDTPRAYLPVQLDPGTATVIIVGVNLSRRLPDADLPDENIRSFRLIVDKELPGAASTNAPNDEP